MLKKRDALKESIEAQKDALSEGMDELSTAPEVYQKAAELADVAIIDMADKMLVRIKRVELYQRCEAKRPQEMAA